MILRMISKAQLKIYKSLKLKKFRYSHRKFIIEGINLCEAALKNNAEIEIILISDKHRSNSSFQSIQKLAVNNAIPFEFIPDKNVVALSDSVTPQGIIAVVLMKTHNFDELWQLENPVILMLDGIQDPGNLGAILRTASWFGVQAIILSNNCVEVYNSKVLRSTAGAFFQLRFIFNQVSVQEILTQLLQKKFKILVTSPGFSMNYTQVEYHTPLVLAIGNERHGVDEQIINIATYKVSIPKKGQGESLNAAVTAGIMLSEIFRNG